MSFDGRLLAEVGVLAAVIDSGSFVRATGGLGLSPSGVSRAIARRAGRVGVRRLDRTTRSVTLALALADEGRRFHERVRPCLDAIEDAATFPLYALDPPRRHPPAKVRAFIDFALRAVR